MGKAERDRRIDARVWSEQLWNALWSRGKWFQAGRRKKNLRHRPSRILPMPTLSFLKKRLVSIRLLRKRNSISTRV